MNGIPRLLRQAWTRWTAVRASPAPASRYRVTPRHNPFAFRRALLREAILRLKRIPLTRR
jgi:hypothetical protein